MAAWGHQARRRLAWFFDHKIERLHDQEEMIEYREFNGRFPHPAFKGLLHADPTIVPLPTVHKAPGRSASRTTRG
jgi:hypothetical protein